MLAAAQSIARNTTTEGRSAEEYRDDFLGRFGALIEAQEMAFVPHGDMTLATLIDRILAPYVGARDAIWIEQSPKIELTSREAMSLALVLHELATNALKHGAFSSNSGQVRISWAEDSAGVRIVWVETGGPPVRTPSTTGYGTELIKSAVAYSLGGSVEQKFNTGGLEVEIVIPLRRGRVQS